MFGGFQNHHAGRMIAGHVHRHIGTGGAHFRRTGGQTRCWDASCGGGQAPISGDYVLRQCNMRPSLEAPLPPWCENVPQPHRKNRGLRY
jgi:hypothetical protein